MKQIKKIIQAPVKHWVGDGFHVHGFFNHFSEDTSPFLLLDYAPVKYFPASDKKRGVGQHPHRGFETVTFAYKGSVNHKDSNGSVGTIKEGDIQWMTAGSGVIHQEFFEDEFNMKGGEFSMVQLWVNLPAKFKMVKPRYQEIKSDTIPQVNIDGIKIKVVSGVCNYQSYDNSYETIKGMARTYSDINIYQISSTEQNSKINFKIDQSMNTMILVLNGIVNINGADIDPNSLVILDNSGQDIVLKTSSTCEVLVLAGKPLNEPIAHYGPFVMNTDQELLEAVEDYNSGKFGRI